ncbi:MAG: hypothetical protein O2895_01865 [Chloroflexi bacterium]|nr:hypothetical protein [Chloroflexota bacterium]
MYARANGTAEEVRQVVIVKVKRGDGEGSETIEDINIQDGEAVEMSASDQHILIWNGNGDDADIIAIFPSHQVLGVLVRAR